MYFKNILDPVIAIICFLRCKYKKSCCYNYGVGINQHNNIIIFITFEVEILKDMFLKMNYSFDNWVSLELLCDSLNESIRITDYTINQIKRREMYIHSDFLIE